MLALIVGWAIAFFFVFVFYCGANVWAEWSTVINLATYCPEGGPYQLGLAISDFLMDVMIMTLPIPLVRSVSDLVLSRANADKIDCTT